MSFYLWILLIWYIKGRRTLLLQSNTHNHKRGLFTSIKNVQRTEGTTKPEKRYIKMYNAEATNSKEKTLQQMIIRPKPLRQQEQQRTPSATKNRVEWSQKLQHKYKLSTDSEEKFAASRVDDPLREHKIIHLISRPTQLYYQVMNSLWCMVIINNIGLLFEKICRR